MTAEKILDRTENIPESWGVHGTVGYEVLSLVNGLFVDSAHEKDFEVLYEKFIGHKIDSDSLVYSKKKFFLLTQMAGEINSLGHRLDVISEKDRRYRDFTRNNLTLAIREVIACFPVYRTYISPETDQVSPRDEKYIRMAVEKAKTKTLALNPAVYDFLRDVLLLKLNGDLPETDNKLYQDFVLRFQQLTAPIMAKGMEDTVFYVYNRLLSLNEVGGDPFRFGCERREFHRKNAERSKRWPFNFAASSTHDTKRSEDVRMRINVLSEIPEEWAAKADKWHGLNQTHKKEVSGVPEPRPNMEYFIYQTLLGVWPNGPLGPEELENLTVRVWEYCLKAVREAKIFTDWQQPNAEYEEAIKNFIFRILSPGNSAFQDDFLPFQQKLARWGRLNSLSSLVLKMALPGVTETFQGNELWEYRLVDPDNRRPVDFAARVRLLKSLEEQFAETAPSEEWFRERIQKDEEGLLKLFLTWRGHQYRKAQSGLFLYGDYLPLEITGEKERHAAAFLRQREDKIALTVCGRFFSGLFSEPAHFSAGGRIWGNTAAILPPQWTGKEKFFLNIFTGKRIQVRNGNGRLQLPLAEVFGPLSTALLEPE